jgi:hypothetical protein
MSKIRLGVAFVSLFLASCAATRPEVAPPEFLRPVALTVTVEPKVGEFEAPTASVTDEGRQVELQLALHLVEPRVLEALKSQRGVRVFSATACPEKDVERWLGELHAQGELRSLKAEDNALQLAEGRPGFIQHVKHLAYIRAFEMQQEGNAAIADPQIDVVDEGVSLRASGARAADGLAIDVDLELCFAVLDRPLRERTVHLLSGAGVPVTVQAPTGWTWTLHTDEPLAPGEALLVTGCMDTVRGPAFVAVLRSTPSAGGPQEIARAAR